MSFFKLPCEVRVEIYEFYCQQEIFHIKWINGKKRKGFTYEPTHRHYSNGPELTSLALQSRRLKDLDRRRRSGHWTSPYTTAPGPTALLLACRLINIEATWVFYQNSTFQFHGSATIEAFLDTVGSRAAGLIGGLELKRLVKVDSQSQANSR